MVIAEIAALTVMAVMVAEITMIRLIVIIVNADKERGRERDSNIGVSEMREVVWCHSIIIYAIFL